MATRSSIAIQNGDGTVTAVYCHWDGYPEHHKPLLTEYYNTEESVRELLRYGDLSSLDKTIGEKHSFEVYPDGQCTFFKRDRGELGCDARTFASIEQWMRGQYQYDFMYLFQPGTGWSIVTFESVTHITPL